MFNHAGYKLPSFPSAGVLKDTTGRHQGTKLDHPNFRSISGDLLLVEDGDGFG